MLRVAIAFVLFSSVGLAHAQGAACGALVAPQAMPMQATVVAPVANEFRAPTHQLGAPAGVLSQALGESLAVDQVLFRLQVESCASVASIIPAPSPASLSTVAVPAAPGVVVPDTAGTAMPDATDPAAYKPRTEFDNTPWRFNMDQNGERMTADAFAAWMESKGVRVAKGAAKPAAAVAADGTPPVADTVEVAAPEAPVEAPAQPAPVAAPKQDATGD